MAFSFSARRVFTALQRTLSGRTSLQAGLAIVMGIAASAMLPHILGEDFATRRVARLYAPVAGEVYGNGSRDAITVALIDDVTLELAGKTWPPAYGYYARVLRNIALYKPKAIFFDIALREFRQDDKSISALANTVCSLKAAGIPVYLASQPDDEGQLTTIPPMQALQNKCLTLVGVTYKADDLDHEVWEYPLEPLVGDKPVRSAAAAMYADLSGKPLPNPATRMALTWGLHPAPDGLTWRSSSTAAENESPGQATNDSYCRNDFGLMELAPPGIKEAKFADAEKPVCVFHHTVYVHQLGADEATDARITPELRGKIVLVGTDRKFGGDFINSPIHDRIPGVYLHAMALDNLLTYGADYKRVTSLAANWNRDNLKLLLLTVISLSAVALIRYVKNDVRRKRAHHRKESAEQQAAPSHADTPATRPDTGHRSPPVDEDFTWRRFLSWAARKTAEAMRWATGSLFNLLLSALLVIGVLVVGQHILNVGFLTVVDVAGFALAAEWFDWNEKLLEWLRRPQHERNNE